MQHSWRDPHMIQSTKSLLRAVYITLGIFLALFVFFHISVALYVSYLSDKQVSAFQTGIAQDEAYLKTQGDAVAQNTFVIDHLLSGDTNSIVPVLQQERVARGIGLLGITDATGVVVGRTLNTSKIGDNLFLTAPWGRAMSKGAFVQTIEEGTVTPTQLIVITDRPIMYHGRMIGSLSASYLTDDAYVHRFQTKYLASGVQVVFYTKQFGVYGDGFSDQNTRALVNSYFNYGSDWIQNGLSDKTVSFPDGTTYLVENVVFPGLEKSPGGALLFIPRRDISDFANGLTAFLVFLVFLTLALRQHRRTKNEERGWRYYVALSVFSLPVFGLIFFALHLQNIGRLHLERVPYTLYNSTLRFEPEWGVYTQGFEQHFSIIAETGDESINAIAVGLMFDPQAIIVKSFDVSSSSCSYIIENSIDQTAGTAHLSCAIIHPTVGQRSFFIADVVVVPRRIGVFTLSFDQNETKVLANDGLGTNVLRISQNGSYQVDDFNRLPSPYSSTTTNNSVIVFSPTHPNQSRWYNTSTASFVWQGKTNDIYHYAFDTSPDTTPSSEHTIQGTALDVPIPGDGIFYFHLQLASGGPIAHYRIQSDQTSPTILAMNISEPHVIAGDVVRFSFEAEDRASGIQNNYYVDLGNHLFLPIGSQLFVPFLEAGDQTIILRVYDTAGNYTEKSKVIHVDEK